MLVADVSEEERPVAELELDLLVELEAVLLAELEAVSVVLLEPEGAPLDLTEEELSLVELGAVWAVLLDLEVVVVLEDSEVVELLEETVVSVSDDPVELELTLLGARELLLLETGWTGS